MRIQRTEKIEIRSKQKWLVIGALLTIVVLIGAPFAQACDCGCEAATASDATGSETLASTLSFADYDFFTNFGEYMPRAHCLRKAEGSPDWPWIIALIGLNAIIIAGYLRIVSFWRRCYLDEKPEDRDKKLKDLAYIFIFCATCGYAFSIVIFFWPVYRLQAIFMIGLAIVTWRFATDLEPFRKSFSSHRLERELNAALQKDKTELEEKHRELTRANHELAATLDELKNTNKDLDEFVYAASHDLRSPLRAIESLSQFVLEDAAEDLKEGPRQDLKQLQGRVLRMDRMLNGLLDYSRSRRISFRSQHFAICEVLEAAVNILNVPIGFHVSFSDDATEMFSPQPPLEQVLRNLIDNAIKHHDRDQGTIVVTVLDEDDFVRFQITDDGPGIAAENEQRVFEMFQTLTRRDEKDTNGMGLALVKRIVESHGGSVSIAPQSGRGATFEFTWPKHLSFQQQRGAIAISQMPEELTHV